MSDQESADVDRFLDRLGVRSDERAEGSVSRRARSAMPRWAYMTRTTTDTKTGRSIRLVNGERLEQYRPESPELAEAGMQGWELIAVVAGSGKQEHVLYFERPLAES